MPNLAPVKILSVSDIHDCAGYRQWVSDQRGFDIIFLPGDLIDQFGLLTGNQSNRAKDWVRSLAQKVKYVGICSGNHDDAEMDWISALAGPNIITDNQLRVLDLNGVRLAVGSASNNWKDDRGLHELNTDLIMRLAATAADHRILLHHTPPKPSAIGAEGEGDLDGIVLRQVLEANPGIDLVFSGHIHSRATKPQGVWYDRVGRTLCVNSGQNTQALYPAHIIAKVTPQGIDLEWEAYSQKGLSETRYFFEDEVPNLLPWSRHRGTLTYLKA